MIVGGFSHALGGLTLCLLRRAGFGFRLNMAELSLDAPLATGP